jgi:Tfp pilus assembly protein PilO
MFGAIAAVLILAAWYLLLWSPSKSDLDKAKERRQAAEGQQAQLEAEISRLRDAQKSEPSRRAQLELLRTAIPDTPNLAQFILDVNDAAAKAGIDFISIAPTEPRQPTGAAAVAGTTTNTTPGAVPTAVAAPAEIAIALQLQGGYFQVVDFLNRLDKLPRLLVTDTLNISADTNGRLTTAVSARMFVRAIPAGFVGATTTTTVAGGAGGSTTTTAPGGVTTTTASGGASTTTTTAGARP